MADSFNKNYYFSKGIYEAKFFSNVNRDLIYYDNKLTDGNIASSVNNGEILAGLGNVPQLYIFDSAKLTITLTAADIALRMYQMQTGGTLSYNGIVDTCEVITATSASLTVAGTPAMPYGYNGAAIPCYINGGGTAYFFGTGATSQTVQNFVATAGTTYTIRYYVSSVNTQVLDVKSLFTPEVGTMEIKYPIYTAAPGSNAASGTIAGYLHAIAPRFQFAGELNIQNNQTTAATGSLTGSALAYDQTTQTQCNAGNLSSLMYLQWEPVDTTSGITGMVVMNGGQLELSLAAAATGQIVAKYVMADGMLANCNYSTLTFTSVTPATATVGEHTGIVTPVQVGSTEVTIADSATDYTATCAVDVVA